ncbi:MAG TPA: hypothetical protein VLI05_00665 [Candidatus Saccharimonadia bacterium]|nr:hypothetical protein [Candidatus Saccharimonadia bacterium]
MKRKESLISESPVTPDAASAEEATRAVQRFAEQQPDTHIGFLLCHGVNLEKPDRPDVATYLRDHPEASLADYQQRLQTALEAEAAIRRHRQAVERLTLYIQVRDQLQDLNRPASEIAAAVTQLRRLLIAELWRQGLWLDPWRQLVDIHLPGAEPPEFYNTLAGRVSQALARQMTQQESWWSLCQRMITTLAEHGLVVVAEGDRRTVHRFASLRLELDDQELVRPRSYGDGSEWLQWATQPEHPAWERLFFAYFTALATPDLLTKP